MVDPQMVKRLLLYRSEAERCTSCHAHGLLHVDERGGRAMPMLQRSPTGALGILIIGEAPNWDDTYDPEKGYLTYDYDTDPTGTFMHTLLIEEAGLTEAEIGDLLFTNAVLCLPKAKRTKYPVVAKQLDHCRVWLVRLIRDAEAKVVVTMGATPLQAVSRIERHQLSLKNAGRLHPWFGRALLPLYHAGRLGRISRPEALQRQDMRALRTFLGRDRGSI
jgi:uracil-DNA glycosylase